jgi:hypothetical protein
MGDLCQPVDMGLDSHILYPMVMFRGPFSVRGRSDLKNEKENKALSVLGYIHRLHPFSCKHGNHTRRR